MNVALRPQHYLSLCTGGGGLELGVRLGASGIPPSAPCEADDDTRGVAGVEPVRPVAYVERDLVPATLLAHRIATKAMAPAPIWSDLKSFDFRAWRGLVDGIVGGYPCQPFSYAGARRGVDDPRHLWPAIAAGIRAAEPAWCFFENVAGHLSLGFREVAGDLQGMGYRVAPALVTAEEVGAPHRRERLFILAYRDLFDDDRGGDERQGWRGEPTDCRPELADAYLSGGSAEPPRLEHQARAEVAAGAGAVGDSDLAGLALGHWQGGDGQASREARGSDSFASGRADVPEWPPRPGDTEAWRRVIAARPDLAPAVESDVRGGADGLARGLDLSRSDRLRILGNGCVPQQAAHAWRLLWREFGVEWGSRMTVPAVAYTEKERE